MKLLSLHLPAERPKELGYLREIDFKHPVDIVLGARVLVRGPTIILLYPDGHKLAGGYEFTRTECTLRWGGTEVQDYDKVANWTSDVLERAKAPEIPEMDRPKVVAK